MRGVIQLWIDQLWTLAVLRPAWLPTPEGRKVLFSRSMLWRLALALAFALAVVALLQSLPADMALIGAGDIITYLDVVVVVWAAGAVGLVRTGAQVVSRALRRRGLIATRRGRRAAMRRRRPRRLARPANDDGPAGERWTIAA